MEQELKTLESQMSDPENNPDVISSPEVFDKYNKLKQELEQEEKNWEKLNLELESILK